MLSRDIHFMLHRGGKTGSLHASSDAVDFCERAKFVPMRWVAGCNNRGVKPGRFFLGYKGDLWSVPSGKITNYHIAMEHPWERSILGVSKRDYPDTFEAHVNFRPAT